MLWFTVKLCAVYRLLWPPFECWDILLSSGLPFAHEGPNSINKLNLISMQQEESKCEKGQISALTNNMHVAESFDLTTQINKTK